MAMVATRGVKSSWMLPALIVALGAALFATLLLRTGVLHLGQNGPMHAPGAAAPENVAVEAQLGVRFSNVAVVGGGGLVELTYTVLDPEKATTFQSDTTHPPTLYRTGDSDNPVHIAALMKQGHNLRPGQTYFILYENPHGIVKSGDTVRIESKAGALADFPVE
jgi:hypothetical protein